MKQRVRAIIVQDHDILLIHRRKPDQEYWVFPGGGVEESDNNLQSALERECKEELGVDIKVEKLFLQNNTEGVEEYFFITSITGGRLGTGQGPEWQPGNESKGEYILEWVPLEKCSETIILPQNVKEKIITQLQ